MTIRKRRARLTDAARKDLRLLAQFIHQHDPEAAKAFVQDIVGQIYHLAEIGVTGSTRAFLPPDIRVFPYRKRTIFFRVTADTLTVLRVLHQAQDVNDIVFDPPAEN